MGLLLETAINKQTHTHIHTHAHTHRCQDLVKFGYLRDKVYNYERSIYGDTKVLFVFVLKAATEVIFIMPTAEGAAFSGLLTSVHRCFRPDSSPLWILLWTQRYC